MKERFHDGDVAGMPQGRQERQTGRRLPVTRLIPPPLASHPAARNTGRPAGAPASGRAGRPALRGVRRSARAAARLAPGALDGRPLGSCRLRRA
jgi:hypothetical protein